MSANGTQTYQVDELRRAGNLIASLSGALDRGDHALDVVPGLLGQILRDGSWREFTTQRGEHIEYQRFEQFVTTAPLKGLGASVELIKRLVADDPGTIDLLDRALQRPASLHAVDNIHDIERPSGTSQDAALRRLRKDRPDLHAQVLAGELKANAAMVEAGFRPPTATVKPTVESFLRAANRLLDDHQREELKRVLMRNTAEE